jgi:hypothetical protein
LRGTVSSQNSRYQELQVQIDELRRRLNHQGEGISTAEEPSRTIEKSRSNGSRDSVTNILMVVFSGLLFLGAMLQWWTTRDAIEDTHKSFQIGTRAWVVQKESHVQPTKMDAPEHGVIQAGEGVKDSRAPVVSVTLINSGHSPARQLATSARIEVLASLISDDYVFPATPEGDLKSVSVLAPDGISVLGTAYNFKGNEFEDVTKGRKFLVMYGVSTYFDIFGEWHQTKFCYFYSRDIEKMVACPHYNSTN